jgi:hypothetical protein
MLITNIQWNQFITPPPATRDVAGVAGWCGASQCGTGFCLIAYYQSQYLPGGGDLCYPLKP